MECVLFEVSKIVAATFGSEYLSKRSQIRSRRASCCPFPSSGFIVLHSFRFLESTALSFGVAPCKIFLDWIVTFRLLA